VDDGGDLRSVRVKLRRAQHEHMFSASPSHSDMARYSQHVSNGPRLCENALFVVIRAVRFPAVVPGASE
jgi:hypothetical protein